MPLVRIRRALPAMVSLVLLWNAAIPAVAALPKVPEGFEARLVATVPAVLYPCQLATAPDGSLFVAEDPMDQVGPYESKHGRILLFREGQEPIVFADGFRAIFGMAWYEGSLYVSHMPFLTVLRDSDGDGKADVRNDLFHDLGQTNNRGLNDHIVSGIQFGMDGYLYIATGDKGIPKATGPDGRIVQIIGGGTLRCRPDGTGLEVVSTGTRNHLDPNLDDRDNLFTYDNTDDGDGWWTRVTHHVDGGYYGYPYDYHNRPDRMLPRMAEYGGGSPCGALVYKEDAWPEKYRGMAFWAEWGKGKVQGFRFAPDGSSFKVGETIDFALPGDVPNFRPIDLALSYDGRTLYVADWGMGGWGNKTEKVGRVFAIRCKENLPTRARGNDGESVAVQIAHLDHPSFNERMRAQRALIKRGRSALDPATSALADRRTPPVAQRHLVWVLDGIAGGTPEGTAPIAAALRSPVADVRAQAARALGERRIASVEDDLIALLHDPEPTVRLQAVIALGRIGEARAVPALLPHLAEKDIFLAFSTRQALRRINAWKPAAAGLDSREGEARKGVIAAMEQVYETDAVEALARFASDKRRPAAERAQSLLALAQGHRKTKPWNGRWWGTRPTQGKPPAKEVDWAGTERVLATVRDRLSDPEPAVVIAAVSSVREVRDRSALPALRARFSSERNLQVKVELAKTFGAMDDREAIPQLVSALRAAETPEALHDAALASLEKLGTDSVVQALLDLLREQRLNDVRKPRVVAVLGRSRSKRAIEPLVKELESPSAPVRAASAEALGRIGQLDGVAAPLRARLSDRSVEVRKSAIEALGRLADRESIPALMTLSDAAETRFEASLALTALPDTRALQVYLRGLVDKNQDLRRASARAISRIRDQAAPILDQLAARHELSPSVVPELARVYSSTAPVMDWRILGPMDPKGPAPVAPDRPVDLNASYKGLEGMPLVWKQARAFGRQGRLDLERVCGPGDRVAAYGYAEVRSAKERPAQLVIGSDDSLTVWLNGAQVYDFQDDRGYEADQARVDVTLKKGANRLLVRCGNHGGPWVFSVGVASESQYAFLKAPSVGAFNPDTYRETALKGQGKPAHGRALFSDPKGLACMKCHTVGRQGGAVGPELSSVGAKYPREELINSVLNPSARISSGYEPVVIATTDGRVLNGIVKSDTAEAVEIEDADAKRIRIPKDEIDATKRSDVSLMPSGLAEGLSPQDFADLIAYLETLREPPAQTGTQEHR